jgi:SAM-dependent methyltransferase
MTWTDGYVADIGYTYGYYPELNPLRARLALLNAGIMPQAARPGEGFTACELGFGQGVSVNIHAAATGSAWWANDFNPAQVRHAQGLAQASGATLHLHDDAFERYAARTDLPSFDFIGLHGIWSWISDENRSVIVDFIRRKLKVGGVVYVSYNTLPGWAQFLTMRHLMTRHSERLSAQGEGTVARVQASLGFMQRLVDLKATYVAAHGAVAPRLERMKGQDPHYLAHEFFNRDWHPMHFADMAQWLEPAKLQYACSAHLLDHADSINLTAEQVVALSEIKDTEFRESVRDALVNQAFRRDYWIKGAVRLSAPERHAALREERVVLVKPRAAVPHQVAGALGNADLISTINDPLLDALAHHQPVSLGELEDRLSPAVTFPQMMQAVMLMTGAGHLAVAQPHPTTQASLNTCHALNAQLRRQAATDNNSLYLASPVTGGGLSVGRFQQNFIEAALSGLADPHQWATYTWDLLQRSGQRVLKDGHALQEPQDNLDELTRQAQAFAADVWPMLQALRVV